MTLGSNLDDQRLHARRPNRRHDAAPAPVQVNFLGYPGTLGGGICDNIKTDSFVTPMTAASDYSEAFAYMPHCYQPHGRRGAIGRKPARSEAGLPEAGFVFCCFNQAYKFTPPVFDLWRRS